MYAVVETAGRQWRLEPGTQVTVNQVAGKVGAKHVLDRVLLANDGQTTSIGQPYLAGAQVLCEILEHRKGPKVITYKFRRRENFRRTRGHRQSLTKLLVKDITLKGV